MISAPDSTFDPDAAAAAGQVWRPGLGKIGGSLSAHPWQDANAEKVKPVARKVKPPRRRTAEPGIATVPVAVLVNGTVIGLALQIGRGFRFFSAAHGTDAFDGEVFATLTAIYERASSHLGGKRALPIDKLEDGPVLLPAS
jgi:hypothetical protein